MKELNELQKEIICDKLERITRNLNDNELDYAIYLLNFWKEERKRQDKELEELYKEIKENE